MTVQQSSDDDTCPLIQSPVSSTASTSYYYYYYYPPLDVYVNVLISAIAVFIRQFDAYQHDFDETDLSIANPTNQSTMPMLLVVFILVVLPILFFLVNERIGNIPSFLHSKLLANFGASCVSHASPLSLLTRV